MKIALVTNKKLHHKYWVSELYLNNDISIIVHPLNENRTIFNKIKTKKPLRYGYLNLFLKIISLLYNKISSYGINGRMSKAGKRYFLNSVINYNKIPKNKIIEVETVNSLKTINLLKKNKIEIICFLGGEIIKKEFIDSFKYCFNYHSGISPFYNGNKTTFQSFSNNKPNFSGGTLMKMSRKIDGGEILSHYITPIVDNDKAEDLFMKGITGSVILYNKLLNMSSLNVKGIKQKKTLCYYRNIDWTIINDIKLKKIDKSNIINKYKRDSLVINYVNKNLCIENLYEIVLKNVLN